MGKTATQEVEVRVVVPPSGSVLVKVWATGADVVLEPDVMVDCGVALASVEDGPGVTDSSIWRVLANLPGLPLNEYLTWEKKNGRIIYVQVTNLEALVTRAVDGCFHIQYMIHDYYQR